MIFHTDINFIQYYKIFYLKSNYRLNIYQNEAILKKNEIKEYLKNFKKLNNIYLIKVKFVSTK